MPLLAHVLTPCSDPDCEVHQIEVGLAEETVTNDQLAFFVAGAQRSADLEWIEKLARERLEP